MAVEFGLDAFQSGARQLRLEADLVGGQRARVRHDVGATALDARERRRRHAAAAAVPGVDDVVQSGDEAEELVVGAEPRGVALDAARKTDEVPQRRDAVARARLVGRRRLGRELGQPGPRLDEAGADAQVARCPVGAERLPPVPRRLDPRVRLRQPLVDVADLGSHTYIHTPV